MKKIDINNCGVIELNNSQASSVNGGGILAWAFGFLNEMSKHGEQQAVNKAMHVLPK